MREVCRVIIVSTATGKNSGIVSVSVSNDFEFVSLDPFKVSCSNITSYRMALEGIAYFFDCIKDIDAGNFDIIFYTQCRELAEDFKNDKLLRHKSIWKRIKSHSIGFDILLSSSVMSFATTFKRK